MENIVKITHLGEDLAFFCQILTRMYYFHSNVNNAKIGEHHTK